MNSLYVGRVHHRRARPRRHAFSYAVYWLLLDLDDLDDANRASPIFSVDGPNLYSFRQADHGPKDGSALKPWIVQLGREAGIQIERVQLLTMPRLFGYAFNPITIWFCHGHDGSLSAVLYEVRNTFGEHHSYFLPVENPDRRDAKVVHEWDKKFFVSPFIDMAARYRFELEEPADRMQVTVRESDVDGHLFSAAMAGERIPLSTRSLLSLLVSHPLLTFRVMVGIHWQAFHLWRKGAPYRSRPAAPHQSVSMPTVSR